jgi:hypothetical protein
MARVRSHVGLLKKAEKGSFHRVESYHYIVWQTMKKGGKDVGGECY